MTYKATFMLENIKIRPATPLDIPAVSALWKALADFHADRDSYLAVTADAREKYADYLALQIPSETTQLLVADHGASTIGFCLAFVRRNAPVFVAKEFGVVDDMLVSEEFRRQGVGEALLQVTLEWFSKRNIHRVEVGLLVANEVSVSFWRKMGFQPYRQTHARNLP